MSRGEFRDQLAAMSASAHWPAIVEKLLKLDRTGQRCRGLCPPRTHDQKELVFGFEKS